MDTFIRHTLKKASRPTGMTCFVLKRHSFFWFIFFRGNQAHCRDYHYNSHERRQAQPFTKSRQPISSATPGSLEVSIDARPAETLLSPSINKLHGITVHVTLIAARMSG